VKLEEYQKTGVWPGTEKYNPKGKGGESRSWSKKEDLLDKRRDKKARRAEKRAAQAEAVKEVEGEGEEEDDMEADYKFMKKLKKGKISQDTFDKAFSIDSVATDQG
jgi:hypothetical protein